MCVMRSSAIPWVASTPAPPASTALRERFIQVNAEGVCKFAYFEAGPQLRLLAAEFLQDIRTAQNLVVLKTAPGHANSVAVALDADEWPEIVGTIAGDDTILVIAKDGRRAAALAKRLAEFAGL